MKSLKIITSLVAFAALSGAAHATTLTFDDLVGEQQIANGYAGLDWSNFFVLPGTQDGPSGYENGTVSTPNVAYNAFGNPASISADTSPFSLNSGYFTAAWNDGLTVSVVGQVGGVDTYSTSFEIDTQAAVLETFNWADLSSVTFTSFGGTNHGYNGTGPHFALDNLTVNVTGAVPEPATWAMMLAGFGMIGMAMRKPAGVRVNYARA